MKRRDLMVEDLGKCACGGTIAASRKSGAVTHSLPPCKPFIDLDPLQFLAYVRRSRGISDAQAEQLARES